MLNRKGHIFISIVLIIFVTTMGLSGCSKKKAPEKEPPKITIDQPQEEPKVENKSPGEGKENEEGRVGVFVGDRAPDFSLLDREGNEIRLSDLRGKVVFVNFWTTWCGFCTYEMPYIQEAFEKYKDKDVVILAVNVLAAEKIKMEDVNLFLDEKGYTFPVLFDVDGSTAVEFKVRGFPATYLIDKDGYIAEFVSGAMEKQVIFEKIENVLNN